MRKKILLKVATVLLILNSHGCMSSRTPVRQDVFVEMSSCALPRPDPSGIGADRAFDLVFVFTIEVGKPHGARQVSTLSVSGRHQSAILECLDRWRFGGWPAGQEGQARFTYSDLRGWEQVSVVVANYRATVRSTD